MSTAYMSLAEAATYLKICKSTLYKKTSLRELPYYKPGGKLILFLKEDLDDYMNKSKVLTKNEIETNYLSHLINSK